MEQGDGRLVGEVRALKPGMGRDDASVGDFVTASLADYVTTEGRPPSAAVMVWVGPEGAPVVSWFNIDAHSLAFMGAAVTKMAFE